MIFSDKFQQSKQAVHVLEGAPDSVHRQSAGPPCCATETCTHSATVQKTGEIPHVQFLDKVDDTRCCTATGAWSMTEQKTVEGPAVAVL